jgi:DNA-binding MarR family transcriptional regulator
VIVVSNPTEVPWLSGEERAAWVVLVGLFMTVPSAVDTQLRQDSGLNFFDYSILVALAETPGMQMTNLATLTGGSLSRLSHAVSRLERQGWVRRQVQTGEVRCTEVSITESGQETLDAAAPGHVREVRRLVFDVLTPEQVGQMREVCRRMVEVAGPETARVIGQSTRIC